MGALVDVTAVWCVWTEWGEYEQHSRDLRGVFTSRILAESHAAQLAAETNGDKPLYDIVEAVEETILTEVPVNVPYIEWSAHILPDGTEDGELGFSRGEKFRTYSNEIEAATGRIGKWHGELSDKPDLFIEVVGSDRAAVEAEYARLLSEARGRLGREE